MSTPREIKAMLKAGIPVAIVPRTFARKQLDKLRDSSVTSSAKRKHPSISREALQLSLSQARQRMRRRAPRPRRRTQGVANTTQLRDYIKDMLRSIRQQAGLTSTELANKMGVAPSNIARLESGRITPSIITIDAFFKACGFELLLTAEKVNVPNQANTSASSSPGSNVQRTIN
jgi:ribosome-binding protein aMBF1 (putative translation factor)